MQITPQSLVTFYWSHFMKFEATALTTLYKCFTIIIFIFFYYYFF